MAEVKKHVYDESKIKTLSSLEHIRLRTGMYIGRIGDGSHYDDGCYVLLKEVIDNAIDEYIMGHGKEVQIGIEGTFVTVRDFGRGIPLGKVVDCVSKINTGAKYNDDVFQFTAFVPTPLRPTQNQEREERQGRQTAGRNVCRVRAGRDDLQGNGLQAGTCRAPAAPLQLPEHGAEADLENARLA